MIIPSRRGVSAACALAAALGGTIAAAYYHRLGLTLSHYDARGHLVVARRVIDSLTPGWQQIGAVWLPLPHVLNLLPVQIDAFYRSGASAVAISIAAFALATGAIAWIVTTITGSAIAGVAGAAVFALNPNLVYLQATPMTEPLMLGLTLFAVALLIAFVENEPPRLTSISHEITKPRNGISHSQDFRVFVFSWRIRMVGCAFALACLTRYEAWFVTAAALILAARSRRDGLLSIALYPAAAAAAFLVFSRVVVGQWFVAEGFFVPENKALGSPYLSAAEIAWGTRALSGELTLLVAGLGLAALAARGFWRREHGAGLVAVSLGAAAALPWAAFLKGHPFRIRYMVPLVAAEAIGAGAAAGIVPRRLRTVAAILVAAVIAYELRPLDRGAPMVVEAQWDQPNAAPREAVTDCLRHGYAGETIMASMGSLGHYMQEASHDGFAVRDFLHEGNGDIWLAALDGPRPFVGWILIEEKANGGDMLARIARRNPHFLDGFSRVCDGAGLALYRRQER